MRNHDDTRLKDQVRQAATQTTAICQEHRLFQSCQHRQCGRAGRRHDSGSFDRSCRCNEYIHPRHRMLHHRLDGCPGARRRRCGDLGEARGSRDIEPSGEASTGRIEFGDDTRFTQWPGRSHAECRCGATVADHRDEAHGDVPDRSTPGSSRTTLTLIALATATASVADTSNETDS